jgi:predicted TIM-barrel fold metal-dependent hydrolase
MREPATRERKYKPMHFLPTGTDKDRLTHSLNQTDFIRGWIVMVTWVSLRMPQRGSEDLRQQKHWHRVAVGCRRQQVCEPASRPQGF